MTPVAASYAPLHDPSRPVGLTWPASGYLVSPRHRMLYCPIQKVACSSLKLWWAEVEDGRLTINPRTMDHEASRKRSHGEISGRFDYAYHFERLGAEPLVDPRWFRFAFVRDPWSRLVSAFINKFVQMTDHGTIVLDDFRRRAWQLVASRWLSSESPLASARPSLSWFVRGTRAWEKKFTFRLFVEYLSQIDLSKADLHWRPQTEFLGGHEFHYIGRMESLVHDFDTVRTRLAIPTPLRVSNVTNYDAADAGGPCVADWPLHRLRRLLSQPHYLRFYSPDLLTRVGQLYASDVQRFGYSSDGPTQQPKAA